MPAPFTDNPQARLELRHLRYFKVVAEELNFTRAAARLHMAQPPLSQQIMQLEDELGVLLLERHTRPMRLTEAGEALLSRANRILSDIATSVQEVKSIAEGKQGRLTIGFAGSAMYTYLPERLGQFQQGYPAVELTFRELLAADIGSALMARAIDVGFSRPPINDHPAILQTLLLNEPLVAALPAAHPLASSPCLTLAELHDQKAVLYPRYPLPSLTDLILNTLDVAAVRLNITQQVENLQAALGLTSAGAGLTFVPLSVSEQPRHGVTFVPIEGDVLRSPLSVAWRADDHRATLRNLMRYMGRV